MKKFYKVKKYYNVKKYYKAPVFLFLSYFTKSIAELHIYVCVCVSSANIYVFGLCNFVDQFVYLYE